MSRSEFEGSAQPELVTQPSAAPTAKWVAGTATGGVGIVLVWVLSLLNVDLPPEVAAVIVLAVTQVAAYWKKNRAVDVPGRHSGP
jgi:hypothetical protein